jgi:hypothetical protein
MGDYQKKRMISGNDNYRLPRSCADSCLGIVISAFIVLVLLNIGFRLYVTYPIPSRAKPVLKGDYFWDTWRVKRYLRSWGMKAENWLEQGIRPINPIICDEVTLKCSLDLRGENIDHLEWCDGLDITSLDISGTHVADLGPLVSQTNLWSLKLDNTAVDDLSPLATWAQNTGRKPPMLHTLSLRNTRVSDLSPLKDIDIRFLYLDGTSCNDLSPIRTNILVRINFSFIPNPGWKGTEHIRACTNVYVNMRHPSYAWTLFDFFYSGEVDQSRYASIRSGPALMTALEEVYDAKMTIHKSEVEESRTP